MSVKENHFALEVKEKEVIEQLENAALGNIRKTTKYGKKIF